MTTNLRRLFESPERILGPNVRPGMTVLEPGCGMGFFTLPLARMVGPEGRVVAVDVQPRMIGGLVRRACKAGLSGRIEAVVGTVDADGLAAHRGAIDFAAALHVVHEVPDQRAFLARIHELLRPGGLLLIVEPKGHVRAEAFAASLDTAAHVGFAKRASPDVRGHAALLERPN
jgi:ubiquinone/menaquinone biosynthesis C-methylase UbiE